MRLIQNKYEYESSGHFLFRSVCTGGVRVWHCEITCQDEAPSGPRITAMSLDKAMLEELRPVIESARRELAQMDPDDVPTRLRNIAKRSDRTLPPPFARSIVHELEENEQFRTAVAERFEPDDSHDDVLVEYLADPESVCEQLRERAADARDGDTGDLLAQAGLRIASLSEQLIEGKKRVTDLRKGHEVEIRDARLLAEDARARAEARNRELTITVSQRDDRITELEARVLALERVVVDVEAKAQRISERVRRREITRDSMSQGDIRQDASPSDPLALAEWLDAAERRARPFRRQAVHDVEPAVSRPLSIPHGVAPDSGDALVVLIEQSLQRIIIDGYNVAGVLHGDEFATRDARDDVIRRASQLARITPAEIVVVFDGSDDEAREGFRSPDGVVVLFSRGETADDAIVDLVRQGPARTVVVTNDREVRIRCASDDCVTIWSSAFIEWN